MEETGPVLIKELLKFWRILLKNISLPQQIINPSLFSYPRMSILLLPCCSSARLWLGVSTPDTQHTFRPGSRHLWTTLCTPTLPRRTPSFSHRCLSLQKNVFNYFGIPSVIDTCPYTASPHWVSPTVQDLKGKLQYHTRCLKHSPYHSRCTPWHKVLFFSHPIIFQLRSITQLINSHTILADF